MCAAAWRLRNQRRLPLFSGAAGAVEVGEIARIRGITKIGGGPPRGIPMTAGLRQTAISITGLAIVIAGLTFVDPRVRDRLSALVSGQDGGTLSDRASELGTALLTALKYQSIENAPLLIFATVGAVLFVFMVRT